MTRLVSFKNGKMLSKMTQVKKMQMFDFQMIPYGEQ